MTVRTIVETKRLEILKVTAYQEKKETKRSVFSSWSFRGFHHCLVAYCLFYVVSTLLIFTSALHHEHVEWNMPLLSELGALSPCSNYYATKLTLIASSGIAMHLIIYLAVDGWNVKRDEAIDRMNARALKVAVAGMCSLIINSTVSMYSSTVVHMIGATGFCGSIAVYNAMQLWISLQLYPLYCSRFMLRIQAATLVAFCITLPAILLCLLATTIHFGFPAGPNWSGNKIQGAPGYTASVVASVLQYLYLALYMAFNFTYLSSLKKVTLQLTVKPLEPFELSR